MKRLETVSIMFLGTIICILMLSTVVQAGVYYVAPRDSAQLNITDEGAAAWQAAMNIKTPCSAKTAFNRAVAGDIVYFRGGTYYLEFDLNNYSEQYYWYNGALNPANAGVEGHPITFMAYPGELPVMDTQPYSSSRETAPAFGCDYHDFIVYDGFKFVAAGGSKFGSINICGISDKRVSNITVKNCIFDGGNYVSSSTTIWSGIFLEQTSYVTIENCRLYHYLQTDNWWNVGAILTYFNDHLTVKNCEIYNCTVGIYLKVAASYANVYNNYIHNCYKGIQGQVYNDRHADGNAIYNNVIAHVTHDGIEWANEEDAHGNDLKVYNNTIYNVTHRGIWLTQCEPGHGAIVYNNIVANANEVALKSGPDKDLVSGYIKECDHNDFYDPFRIYVYKGGFQQFDSLSSWQSSGYLENGGNPGAGSIAEDPKFINLSGTMSQLDDFRLAADSPCRGAGRNGADMGANIDLVGVKTGSNSNSPPPAPGNLRKLQ